MTLKRHLVVLLFRKKVSCYWKALPRIDHVQVACSVRFSIDLCSKAELNSNTAFSRKHPVMNVPSLLFCYLICICSIHESYLRIDVLFLVTTLTDLLNTQYVEAYRQIEAHWQMSYMDGMIYCSSIIIAIVLCKCRIYVFCTWVYTYGKNAWIEAVSL